MPPVCARCCSISLATPLKFTSSGEIVTQVTVDAGTRAALRITVADTGIGIPEPPSPHLFAAFTQADSTTTRRFGGTGLGLAIAKSIVELMGGEIGVESREGHGSTFWFTAALPPSATPGARRARRLPDARILIVDDSHSNRVDSEPLRDALGTAHRRPSRMVRSALPALRAQSPRTVRA